MSTLARKNPGRFITFQELIAAMEVFGRKTDIVYLAHSEKIFGMFQPKKIEQFLEMMKSYATEYASFSHSSGFEQLFIIRFFDKDKQQKAIGIAPLLDNEKDIITLGTDGIYFKETYFRANSSLLTPDREAIRIMSRDSYIEVRTVPLKMEDASITSDLGEKISALEDCLPDRSVRRDFVAQVEKAIKNPTGPTG